MKSLTYNEVVADINVRMILFEKMRIVKNTAIINATLEKTNDKEIVNKNNDTENVDVKKVVLQENLIEFDNSEKSIKENAIEFEVINNNSSNLTIVTDEFINQDNFVKKELSEIDLKKLAEFKKNDDFFLDDDVKEVEITKKGAPNFFKAISGFFNDITKDSVVQEKSKSDIKLKPQRNEIATETSKSNPIELENKPEAKIDLETPQPTEPEESQQEIDNEKAIKAEKLRVIEEEFRLKAEKREADEKLLLEQQEIDLKKSNADFRKNKRKK